MRHCIDATIGFERLAVETGNSAESSMRVLSPTGSPTAGNLFGVLHIVQKAAGVHLVVSTASPG